MKKLSFILLMLFLGAGSIPNAQAQLGKLGKKVSNKVKTEERKAKKAVSNTKKTGKLPKTGKTSVPAVKTPTTGNPTSAGSPSMPSVPGTGEAGCKNTESYFKLARKDLDRIRKPDPNAEPLSIADMKGVVKRVEEQWIPKIEMRDPRCDKTKLESEVQEVKDLIEGKKADAAFITVGTYNTTGVWETVEFGSMEFEKFTNKQSIKLNGPLGNLEGHLVQKATEDNPEATAFDIEGLGQGAILPHKDAAGNIPYYQMAVIQDQKPVAIILFSNTKTREELEQAMDQRAQERLEKENLDPFVKDNLGKIVISTHGPIFKNGKEKGKEGAPVVPLTTSLELGQGFWVRVIMDKNKAPMKHLALTGYPPAGEIGTAIRTRIFFDGEEVGQDLLRCTKPEDVEIVTNATSYREKGFDPNGAAQDAYREGFEGIFAKNPSYGEHIVEFKKYIVNYNVINTEAGEGEEKFPLEVLLAESGPIKVTITENSWKPFCNSGENNYGPTTGVVNGLARTLFSVVKDQAAKEGWLETPEKEKVVYTGSTKVYHEVTGVYMYTIHEGYVRSRMPNGAQLEQGFQMVDGSYHGTIHGTQRYLPPKCN